MEHEYLIKTNEMTEIIIIVTELPNIFTCKWKNIYVNTYDFLSVKRLKCLKIKQCLSHVTRIYQELAHYFKELSNNNRGYCL